MPTYNYSTVCTDGRSVAYVDYNVELNVDLGQSTPYVGVDTQVTVTGAAYSKDTAIKSIRAFAAFRNGTQAMSSGCVGYVNKSIAKNRTGTFAFKFTITKQLWDYVNSVLNRSQPYLDYVLMNWLNFTLDTTANNDSCVQPTVNDHSTNGVYCWAASSPMQYIMYLTTPNAPTIDDVTFGDNGAKHALTILGGYVQTESEPTIEIQWSVDQHHPAIICSHSIALTGAISWTGTVTTGSGDDSISFNIPVPTTAGTVNWTYSVMDSFGNTSIETGSFTVYAYSPPSISNMVIERYVIRPDAGGESHEPADDGTHLWLTLGATIAAVNNSNAWTAVMTYWNAANGESSAVTVTSQDGWTLGGTDGTTIALTRDENQLAGISASDSIDWRFRLTITDALNNSVTVMYDGVVKAGAILDVTQGGVAVGQRSTGSVANPLFEVNYPAILNNDVVIPENKLLKVVTVSDSVSLSTSSRGGAVIVTVSPGAGWTPIGIVGWHSSNTNTFLARAYYDPSTDTVRCYANYQGTSSSAVSITITAYVLCLHTSK